MILSQVILKFQNRRNFKILKVTKKKNKTKQKKISRSHITARNKIAIRLLKSITETQNTVVNTFRGWEELITNLKLYIQVSTKVKTKIKTYLLHVRAQEHLIFLGNFLKKKNTNYCKISSLKKKKISYKSSKHKALESRRGGGQKIDGVKGYSGSMAMHLASSHAAWTGAALKEGLEDRWFTWFLQL